MSFHTITIKSGKTFTPLDTKDVLEVVRDEMGDDVYDYLTEIISDVDLERDTKLSAMEHEMRSYELSCDFWHDFVDDMSERVVKLSKDIEDNKLTKAKIGIELFKIYNDMRGEL